MALSDMTVGVVVTLHQLDAINNNTELCCPNPKLLSNKSKISILQNKDRQKSISPPKDIPKGNDKPLHQRQAEYAQHRARIFKYGRVTDKAAMRRTGLKANEVVALPWDRGHHGRRWARCMRKACGGPGDR